MRRQSMNMKTRMTITIEPGVSHRAKAVARAQGTSLSGFVEFLLAREAGMVAPVDKVSFGEKWTGALKLAPNQEARARQLRERYGY
jgi:hypothetical protein